ncbi:hypothetical protein K070079E91_28420 [Eisenbergiella porci]
MIYTCSMSIQLYIDIPSYYTKLGQPPLKKYILIVDLATKFFYTYATSLYLLLLILENKLYHLYM